MSPLAIEMLLHVHTTPTPYDDHGGSAQREIYAWLLSEGLIMQIPSGGALLFGKYYRTSPRGDRLVEKLCDVALPTYAWI